MSVARGFSCMLRPGLFWVLLDIVRLMGMAYMLWILTFITGLLTPCVFFAALDKKSWCAHNVAEYIR